MHTPRALLGVLDENDKVLYKKYFFLETDIPHFAPELPSDPYFAVWMEVNWARYLDI